MTALVAPLPWWPARFERAEITIGSVEVPSGSIVACDPLVIQIAPVPFLRVVPPGAYTVRVGRADGDLAYAVMQVSASPVVSWEHARRVGEAAHALVARAPGFDVDATTGAYLDRETARVLFHRRFEGTLFDRLFEAGYRDQPGAALRIEGAHQMVAFGTGGDGNFASYWGLDAHGEPSVLVTDFGVLREPEAADSEPADRPLAVVLPFRKRR